MHAQLGGTSKTLNCPPIIVGGVDDHVHVLARLARTITIADWVKELKRLDVAEEPRVGTCGANPGLSDETPSA